MFAKLISTVEIGKYSVLNIKYDECVYRKMGIPVAEGELSFLFIKQAPIAALVASVSIDNVGITKQGYVFPDHSV